MTKKTAILFGFILITFCQTLFCQVERDYHLDKDNMSFFKEAELVVEGRFLKPLHAYAVKDADGKEHYYGICPVIAYRIFKGNAKPGDTIYVTREGTSLKNAFVSPYDTQMGNWDFIDIIYEAPLIASTKKINVLDHFQNDCVMFFKTSTYPKTNGTRYDTLTQYQYLYPFVFYDEGTKLYVSEGKFAGLNDTLFNTRQELYAFMRKVGGYDTTVIGSGTPQKVQTNSNETHHKVIQYGPPSKAPDNSKWTSSYSDKPLPPEVKKRWGKEAKKKQIPQKTTIAGKGDTLTIRGLNFGDTIGKVLFKSADDGGQTYLLDLDNQYYLTWSDTLIKVIVPSIVYKGYEQNIGRPYSGGAESGNIKIITHYGDTSSTNNVNYLRINYSVANIRGNDSIIRHTYLVRQHCDYDFQFTLHRDFENDSVKISVMDTALHLLSKLTGLTLQLERDVYGNLVYEDSINVNGKNIVYFASNTNSGTMTTSRRYDKITLNGISYYYITTGTNIRIVANPVPFTWNYNLSGIVSGQISFYQAFLHEIGHVLLLGHVNDIADIMFYSTGELNYILIPDTSSWTVKGVLANIEASRNINWPANSGLYPIFIGKSTLQATLTATNTNCPNDASGSISTQVTGNHPPFSYLWSGNGITPTNTSQINNLLPGNYHLTLTDSVGCSATFY